MSLSSSLSLRVDPQRPDRTCVCVCAAAGADWERSEVVNSTQGFYSLTGLQPGTQYHLKIFHNNDTRWEKVLQTIGPGATPNPRSDCRTPA